MSELNMHAMLPASGFTLISPAKLNLFLHINGRRPDGYHELQTLFQLLDYGDEISFLARDDNEIQVESQIADLKMEDNLVFRAAMQLQQYALEHCPEKTLHNGVNIGIKKKLPLGGGVGGGSSNAATTLLALNHLWALELSPSELAKIGLGLGADVPIFVHGRSAWAEGVGEQISAVEIPHLWYLVITPNCHVSTAQIFSHERLTRDTPKTTIAPALGGQLYTDLNNDCEPIVRELYPEIAQTIDWLQQFGHGRLTGTGACCFCAFDNRQTALDTLKKAQPQFDGFVAQGVNTSPTLKQLEDLARI